MSDWNSFRTAVAAAFNQALPSSLRNGIAIDWAGGGRSFGGDDGRILLSVTSHVEEHVRFADADLDANEISSSELVTLQVLAESQHDDPRSDALRLIEQVRLGLRKESVTAIFDAEGVTLVEIPMSPQRVPTDDGYRGVSAYAFDVTLRAIFSIMPEAEDAIPLAEHVQGTGALANPDASDIADTIFSVDDPTPAP